jgi:hypothetical protein
MKTRMELAKEFILEMESVLDNMVPLDREYAKDRILFKTLLKLNRKTTFKDFLIGMVRKNHFVKLHVKQNEKEGILMARYLFEIQAKTDTVNAELTMKGRAGDKVAIAQWARLAGLVLLLNKEGGSYGKPIKWTVTAPE